jgi:purine-nucleoside phosphorylase
VLGSGFNEVRSRMIVHKCISFDQLPGFPSPTVEGHAGQLLLAELAGSCLLVCCGRAHYYEGLEMAKVMFPVRALATAGVREFLLTNAAGGINPRYRPGDFMLFADHINFTGVNPLHGFPTARGKCFVDLSEAYAADLRLKLRAAARQEKITLHEGVYLGVAGPTYETPAEIRAFRKLGADAVGMSSIPEAIMAAYCGAKVAAVACITNGAAGLSADRLSHEDVLLAGRQNAGRAARLITAFAAQCSVVR